jgi:drug/metabolite transporter (DMT)-like permease
VQAERKLSTTVVGILLASALLAAVGQVLFKLGADGQVTLKGFANLGICAGLLSYGLGTALWILALSRAPLTAVYPFSALTLTVVYAAGILYFKEPMTLRPLIGVGLVMVGLYFVSTR